MHSNQPEGLSPLNFHAKFHGPGRWLQPAASKRVLQVEGAAGPAVLALGGATLPSLFAYVANSRARLQPPVGPETRPLPQNNRSV